ncbi:BPTI/Kunitz domain-containing protein 4-like [Ruditapes philippinarum]|uniref:BPTI/Kunitz domain-containing protein 4-like n=1 Tax=Ruditapes philippinarum TaxID=129788 RepID=UPI00295B93FD|nr:BPTI/Kunitz domain-containing protein 4-like [Ruditapes philippinarum]
MFWNTMEKSSTCTYFCLLYGCSLFVSVLSHAFNNAVLERREKMDKEQTLKCNNPCPFGFVPDVEGKLTCRCFDPCRNIMCLQGATCFAEMPKNCGWEPCRPVTKCIEETTHVHTVNKDEYGDWLEFPVLDDPDQWLSKNTGNDVDVCSQALPMAAVDCKHKRRRWYFNPMTGKCDRFLGCVTSGNNFGRKLYCKEQCRFPFMKRKNAQKAFKSAEVAQNPDCELSLSVDAYKCENKTKRWHFNSKTNKCEKFTGCKTNGNNFSRKSSCKSSCLAKSKRQFNMKDKHLQESSPR